MTTRIRKIQILKHPNKRSPYWYVRWWELQPDGKTWREMWRSTRTAVKKDAEQVRRQIERELEAGKRHGADMPWEDFVREFLQKHASRKAATTTGAYTLCLQAVTQASKPRCLADVTVALLEDFANARLKAKASPATVNKELRHLRAALRWAMRREYINRVPDFTGAFIRVEERQPVTIPEDDFIAMVRALERQELQLRKRSPRWWRTFLYLAYYLGLRRGEVLGLTWERVRFDTLEVLVSAVTSKGRRDRVVPMAPELAQVLRAWREEQGDAESAEEVLPWPFNTYRHLYDDWHVIQNAAGIAEGRHYVPKNCRSSCASELIAAGVPTAVVKDFLGHASVTTTEKYYINTKPALRSAAKARKVRLE